MATNMEEAMSKASRLKKHCGGRCRVDRRSDRDRGDAFEGRRAREELRAQFDKALKGKTVAWAPVWLGVLESEWTRVMKAHFDDYGMNSRCAMQTSSPTCSCRQ